MIGVGVAIVISLGIVFGLAGDSTETNIADEIGATDEIGTETGGKSFTVHLEDGTVSKDIP